jgi:tRNA (guanine10-N2)-dimethyltransferase
MVLAGSIFVLSGEELSFPSAEIRALVETYSESKCENLTSRVMKCTLSDPNLISKISERAAYCRFGGQFVSRGETISDLTEDISSSSINPGRSFVVDSQSLDRPIEGELGALIKQKTCAKVSLENPDYVFQLEAVGKEFILGVSKAGFKRFSWRTRRPRARKFFLPSAIYPKLARLLVNLSRVKEDEYFLDPFCGTGSLLIESSLMGMKTIGFDLTRWIARGAKLNLKGFSLDFEGILRCDSTWSNLPLIKIDGVSTDVPYGRASSTKGKDTETIIREFTTAFTNLVSGRKEREKSVFCVLMHPHNVNFDYDRSVFELTERHLLYVHRNLTRAISVLKSKS